MTGGSAWCHAQAPLRLSPCAAWSSEGLLLAQEQAQLGTTFAAAPFSTTRTFASSPVLADHASQTRSYVAGSALGLATMAAAGSVALSEESTDPLAAPPLEALPTKPVLVYQYEVCPFCNKLRAYFDYKDIPYIVVEVNPLTKAEIKGMRKNNGKLKVPIVKVDGVEGQLVESDAIIDEFQGLLEREGRGAKRSWFSGGGAAAGKGAEEVARWRRWVNETFVHVLTVNIYRSVRESFETFDYISDQGNFGLVAREAARYGGAGIMYVVSKNIKKKRSLPGEERDHLYKCCGEWMDAVGDADFHGGKKPDLADLSVYGVMRAVEGFESFKDAVANTKIGPWYYRVKEAVGASARTNPVA